jgi:predicted nucleotidyltransferase/HEPN domain-containing protein
MQHTAQSGKAEVDGTNFDLHITEEKVEDAVRRVVSAANPLMVIAFGSWARGEHRADSDLDIAVVLDEKSVQLERGELQTHLHDVRMSIDALDVGLERFKRNSLYLDTVYRDIAEEGIFLYGRSEDIRKYGSPIPSYEELLGIKMEEVECVMEKARSGEKTLGFDGIAPQIGAFHGHMAIEKMLKAWLIALDIRPQRFQKLGEISAMLIEAGVELPVGAVAFEVFEEHAARYRCVERSDEGAIDLAAMRQTVRELREFVSKRISQVMIVPEPL